HTCVRVPPPQHANAPSRPTRSPGRSSPEPCTSRPSPRSLCTEAPTTAIYTLSLHTLFRSLADFGNAVHPHHSLLPEALREEGNRSEEHTSELQSRENLVCRPLLEKKNARPAEPPPGSGGQQFTGRRTSRPARAAARQRPGR